MANKIFRSILSVAIIVLISSLIIITGVLYQYFGTMQENLLKDELHFAATAAETFGNSYLEQWNSQGYRLTLVNPTGQVLFDSHANPSQMENHKDREEIREALSTGKGSSIRQSSTLTEQTIYEAISLQNGNILRISVSRATVFALLLGILPPTVVVFILSIVLSAWLARRMAKRAVAPLNTLDLEHPLENDIYEELSPLLHRIHAQHLNIKEHMETLQYKQKEFDEITENMKEALVLLDNEKRILSINPAAKMIFSAATSSVGQDFLTIDRKQKMRLALEETENTGHASFHTQVNGREYQFDLNRISSPKNNHGTVILAFDITEQVHAERNRREFTANVSHELKTPLQSIIGSSELIKSGVVKAEDLPRFAEYIHKEASRLVTLINDILYLSQLDEGTQLPFETLSLKTIAEEVLEVLSTMAKQKNLVFTLTGDEGSIHGNRRLLYEILYNLCDNAIKYTPHDGSITVSISRQNTEVLLTVRDTGIGIPIEHHEKIFERFYRVDKSHSKESGGTGLGLSIVKHAVQYHHGTITIDSKPGTGTSISIRFPSPL